MEASETGLVSRQTGRLDISVGILLQQLARGLAWGSVDAPLPSDLRFRVQASSTRRGGVLCE